MPLVLLALIVTNLIPMAANDTQFSLFVRVRQKVKLNKDVLPSLQVNRTQDTLFYSLITDSQR